MSRISDAIKKDHRELEQYYNNIINAKDSDEATRWQNQFTWELARHSIGEELVVYPGFEKLLGQQGKQMADKDRADHQTVKEELKKFQNLKAESPEFLLTIKALMSNLSNHIKEEEEHDLPALDSKLSAEDSESMAKSFGRTKAFVPSRSHPSAPDKPPFETAVGLLAAPIDHLADLFRKFPDETAKASAVGCDWEENEYNPCIVLIIGVMRHRQSASFTEPNKADIEHSEDGHSIRSKRADAVVPAFRTSLRRRPARMPSSATFSKSVHFDPHLERVRHFLHIEQPLAVAAGSPPAEPEPGGTEASSGDEDSTHSRSPSYELEIITANFPTETYERLQLPVRVEKLDLSPDNVDLIGTVVVANLAFYKTVIVRFTLDFWKTTSEVLAEYTDDTRRKQQYDGCDHFTFAIKIADLANLDERPMFFCIKYCVNDMEYWDNNNNYNFQVEFRKKLKPMSG
ncbi:hypothetical protein V493_00689 [Pseudogymnoascus sp. VKM F-4281 (FW-2241)]|nr:hypothetical protein V493_00689 [Pseudogymnoascus sp. VKM F-4281 (FW-2241)]